MTDSDAILVRVLAAADAALLPIRDWDRYIPTNRYFALREMKAFGIPFRANAASDSDRKAGERELVALQREGMLIVRRRVRVKFPGVRLTAKGDARARALCDIPNRADARVFLAAVVERAAKYIDTISGRWCPEIDLNCIAPGKGWGDSTKEERDGLGLVEQEFAARVRVVECVERVWSRRDSRPRPACGTGGPVPGAEGRATARVRPCGGGLVSNGTGRRSRALAKEVPHVEMRSARSADRILMLTTEEEFDRRASGGRPNR